MLSIGVDVGGTNIKSALIKTDQDGNMQIVERFSLPTQGKEGARVIIDNIVQAITRFDIESVDTIGVASAGTIDWDSGNVTYATDTLRGFTGIELSKLLTKRIGKRVIAVNDAVGALVGECVEGSGKGYDKVMMFTLGTGLGASLLTSLHLDNNAVVDTRLGHLKIHPDGYLCSCGERGCSEQYVSATALKRESGLEDLYDLFDSQDERIKQVAHNFYVDFVTVLERAVEIYHPQIILVGGGVVELQKLWWNDFLQVYSSKLDTPICPATLGNKAGVVGAVYCAKHGIFAKQ